MKVLMISSDDALFKNGSDVRGRIAEYGTLFDELHVVTLSTLKIKKDVISQNTFTYSTCSFSKWFSVWDGYMLAKKILSKSDNSKWAVSTQDPFLTGFAGWLATRKTRIPWQIQIHTDVLSPFFAGHSLSNKIRVLIAKFLIPRADGLRVVSERIKTSILKLNLKLKAKYITVLPIFSKLEKIINSAVKIDLHQKYGRNKFIILMPTRLNKEKDIETALQAVSSLIRANRRILLLIVGEGPEKENLKRVAYDLGLTADNVAFEEWSSDLPSYYKTADLYLLTSVYEGGARAPLEALAAGLPVIMTDVAPANEEVVDGYNGRVIPVGDVNALAECLKELITEPEKLSKLKKGALSFKAPRTHEEYLNLYKELLENFTSRP